MRRDEPNDPAAARSCHAPTTGPTWLARGLNPTPQRFRHTPGLRDAPARRERRLGIEDFVDRPNTAVIEMRQHGFHNLSRSHRVFQLTYIMTDEDERELETELARLQQEHRDLDAAIDALHQSPAPDLLRLQRLKKRKLQLRDRIAFIEDQITPDIIA